MGQKVVRFSDLTGDVVSDDGRLVRLVIHDHPDLGDGPVQIEALPDEVKALTDAPARFVTVDLYSVDEEEPQRVVVDIETFDGLATAQPMAELLATAKPVRRPSPRTSARTERLNYATLEHAGKPHKGKTTDAEKRLVREHLDEINERLAAEGIRTIDLTNPEHVDRYDLQPLAADRTAEG